MIENLQIMKFGGTSLGDEQCIRRAVEIVGRAARQRPVAVVVSAMSGTTNRLLHAAKQASEGDRQAGELLVDELNAKHGRTAGYLITGTHRLQRFSRETGKILCELEDLCRKTSRLRLLAPEVLDSILGVGERLSARLVAEALSEYGNEAVAIDATELIVTNEVHGNAEPLMELTQENTSSRLYPFFSKKVIPVVTGFIGATRNGRPTTLGRGGSDYSATLMGAALAADEVVIWTDVDGIMTADPRLVPEACTIPRISYQEASEMARFGAKVLHSRTLKPVHRLDIPVFVRNSFAPDKEGTRITGHDRSGKKAARGITSTSPAALITVMDRVSTGKAGRTAGVVAALEKVQVQVLQVFESQSSKEICVVVPSSDRDGALSSLRKSFGQGHVRERTDAALVAVIGQKLRAIPWISNRIVKALEYGGVTVFPGAEWVSDSSFTLLVDSAAMAKAVQTIHDELGLSCREDAEV